ncbi:leucine-rich_repeat domain-containing protein [Hexamita inflata]|uniref:Leucine-rich repeat domain-containing protein n=1 Tax=Hexamita inflata TaxID=28002 RepID=A0AA86QG71_9EUKA|nr:leucine-rich repeat domain-containing protein [Hexamita inflata]
MNTNQDNFLDFLDNIINNVQKLDIQSDIDVTLQKFVSLTKLSLSQKQLDQRIYSIIISKLVNLEYLDISYNYKHGSFDVVDITPLQYLVKLTYLNLHDCACFDSIQSIHALINLNQLILSSNSLQNLNPLKNLTKLTELNINNNNLIDVTPLKYLVELQKLHLSYNRALVDISPLQYLTKLIYLELERCNIYEISALRPLENLKQLYFGQNQIVILFPLVKLKQLGLSFSGELTNKISDSIYNTNLNLNFKFHYVGQRIPTEEDKLLAYKMHIVDTTNILLRSRNSFQKAKTNTIQENRKKLNAIMLYQVQNYSLFSSNLASAMQCLNVSESQQ